MNIFEFDLVDGEGNHLVKLKVRANSESEATVHAAKVCRRFKYGADRKSFDSARSAEDLLKEFLAPI
jgi:hypothetical protein